MRILMVHAHYRQRGGEDTSFETEARLLRELGHEVVTEEFRNADLEALSTAARAVAVLWNRAAATRIANALTEHRSEVAYLNNLFPALSASVVRACTGAGVGTVLAVRNYRLACTRGTLFRDGAPCTRCVGRAVPAPAVVHRCFQDSALSSATAAAALRTVAHLVRTSPRVILAPVSQHVADVCHGLGIPPERTMVKPNTVHPAPGPSFAPGDGLAVVGRLEPEKGVLEAIAAFRRVRREGERMVVVGDGSLAAEVAALAGPDVIHRPEMAHADVLATLASARAAVVPSLWEEPFGRVAVESLACGTPAVVTRRGGLADLVEHGRDGLIAGAGRGELENALDTVLHDDYWSGEGRRAARSRFDAVFSPSAVGRRLVEVLDYAVARSERASASA